MYDEDLLQAVRETMAKERPAGFGVTPYELAEGETYSTRHCRKILDDKVKAGELAKEKMIDFDGVKRIVYYSIDSSG